MELGNAIKKYGKTATPFSEVLGKVKKTYGHLKAPDIHSVYDELEKELDRIEEIVIKEPRSENRKAFMIYQILRQYEMVNMEGSFDASQREGIRRIRDCLNTVRNDKPE